MKKSSLLIALMLATLAGGWTLAPVPANADSGWSGRHRCCEGGHRMQRMAQILGLSAEQQTKIQEITNSERQTVAPLLEKLRTSREELRNAARAEKFDEAAVRKLAEAQAATRTELIVARARTRSQIQAVLTPDQRALAERIRPLLHERRGHRGDHDHRGRGFGPDGPEF